MQKVYNLTNKYFILATPLILYTLFSSIYMAVSANGKLINLIIAFILFILMTGAFLSGWFFMIKTAITEDKQDEPNTLIKDFPSGVGEYFLTTLGGIVNVTVITLLFIFASYFIGLHYIGDPNIAPDAFVKAFESPVELKAFIASLTEEQLYKIGLWNILILSSTGLAYFLVLLYFPAIFFKNKNPFIAFFVSLKDLFSKKIITTIGIYLLIFIGNFIISILSALFANNLILHFIVTLLNFYFITYASLGVFYYYYTNFVKIYIGQNIDTTV